MTLVWSADTVGQGWGINPEWGGLRLYDSMRQAEPDIFIHLGDTIYADQPVLSEVKLDDGKVWKNLVTEAKSKAAETLDEFRGAYQYNLMDEHMRRFNSEVGTFERGRPLNPPHVVEMFGGCVLDDHPRRPVAAAPDDEAIGTGGAGGNTLRQRREGCFD